MTVKIQLKQVRQTRKLSQNKLAQLMGMSLQNIQRMEYGDAKSIPLETLDKLCEILDCQPGDLLIRIADDDSQETFSATKSYDVESIAFGQSESIDDLSSHCKHISSMGSLLPLILESA